MQAKGNAMNKNRKVWVSALTAAAIFAGLAGGVLAQQHPRVRVRQVWDAQVLTDAGASNSTAVAIDNYEPIGWFAAEVRMWHIGTVDNISVQVSQDETTWYTAQTLFSDTNISAVVASPVAAYQRIRIPPARFVRLTGQASADTVRVSAWIVIH